MTCKLRWKRRLKYFHIDSLAGNHVKTVLQKCLSHVLLESFRTTYLVSVSIMSPCSRHVVSTYFYSLLLAWNFRIVHVNIRVSRESPLRCCSPNKRAQDSCTWLSNSCRQPCNLMPRTLMLVGGEYVVESVYFPFDPTWL